MGLGVLTTSNCYTGKKEDTFQYNYHMNMIHPQYIFTSFHMLFHIHTICHVEYLQRHILFVELVQ